ncbi:TPA: MAE_28990/MAE_18760 family HEPN-like nuclease [Vibrio vulnificus]
MARLTESDFYDKIGEEFSWRRREIILYKSKIPLRSSDIQTVMLRAGIPFIYAHWEGYVKVCMSLYLRYVSELHLDHNKLTTPFIALSLSNSINGFDSSDIRKKVTLLELMLQKMESRSNIPKKNIINTKSNLRYEVFKEIMFNVDLDSHGLDAKEDLINSLVDTRNHIAHGEYKYISYDTFSSFNDEVLFLLERIKTILENSILNKEYQI